MADNKTSIVITAEDRASAALNGIKTSLGDIGGAATRLVPQLSALTGALTVGGMLSWAKGTIDAADSMNDLSQRIGIGVRSLGQWKLAAEQNGLTTESLAGGVKKLSVYMVEHADRLKAAGITAKDADGALMQLADLFKAMPEGVDKTALAVQLFGKAGVEMIPMLNQGSQGLAQAREKARKYAEELEKLAPKADEFNDKLAELKLHSEATGISLGNYMIGPLDRLVTLLNDLAQGGPKARKALEELAAARLPIISPTAELAIWSKKDDPVFNGHLVTGKINRPQALPGANSPAEVAALARARLLMDKPAAQGKSELQKMLELGQKNELDAYYSTGGEETMREVAEKQSFKSAQAMQREAEATARLRQSYIELADPIQKYRNQLDEIDRLEALGAEHGLTQEQALEARWKVQEKITEAMRDTVEVSKEQQSLAKELGMTFSSAFEDAVIAGKKFSDVLNSIGQDILRIVMRKNITEPLANAISNFDFSKLFSFNAAGGVYAGAGIGAYSGKMVDRPTLFPFARGIGLMGEAGPEAILPLRRGSDGKLGVAGGGGSMVVNVIEAPGQGGKTAQRNDNGVNILDVFVDRIKSAVAQDIADGRGAIPASLSNAYGLNRAAGAY